jgi:hypothetical protein
MVCVCTSDLSSPKEATNYIYIYSCEMSHIRHLHSSAETCDFAVSSNLCCCGSHNKINDGRLFENCTFSGKWVLQWTMPKINF